jgi:hypothetical protein
MRVQWERHENNSVNYIQLTYGGAWETVRTLHSPVHAYFNQIIHSYTVRRDMETCAHARHQCILPLATLKNKIHHYVAGPIIHT